MVMIYAAALMPIIPSYTFEHCGRVWRAHFCSFKAVPPFDCLCLQSFFLLNASYVFHVIWRHHSLNIKPCIQTIKPEAEKTIMQGKKSNLADTLESRMRLHKYKATQPNVEAIHTHKGEQKHGVCLWAGVRACVVECEQGSSWEGEQWRFPVTWKRLASHLKMQRRGKMSASTKAMKIQGMRFSITGEWEQSHTHTLTHTSRWSDGLREGTGLDTPLHWWFKWKEWRKDEIKDSENWKEITRVESEHTKTREPLYWRASTTASSFSAFVAQASLRSRADSLSLSCPLFIHLSPLFFINSLLVPSLSVSALLNGPLFLMTDWWMKGRFEVKSHGQAGRAWSRVGQKMAAREREEGREGGRRRKRRGYTQQGGNVKQWASIKSARERGWMRVAECEGKSRLSVFAWAPQGICIVALNMQKGQQHASRKSPKSWRSDIFLEQAFRTAGRWRKSFEMHPFTCCYCHGCREVHRLEEGTSGYSLQLPNNCMVAFLKILAEYLHLTVGSFCLINAFYLPKKTSKVHTPTLLLSFEESLFLLQSGNHNLASWPVLRNVRLTDDSCNISAAVWWD